MFLRQQNISNTSLQVTSTVLFRDRASQDIGANREEGRYAVRLQLALARSHGMCSVHACRYPVYSHCNLHHNAVTYTDQ